MFVVEIFLPLTDNDGKAFDHASFGAVANELTERFGGVTVYSRAPATGLWKPAPGAPARDDLVIYEVMTGDLDRGWWAQYRESLEARFAQAQVLIRASSVERL